MYMYVMYITTLSYICPPVHPCVQVKGHRKPTNPGTKKFHFSAKLKSDTTFVATDKASNSTDSRLNQAFRSVRDKMEIDKCAHRWQPGGDERATLGIQDCPLCFVEGDYFVVCVLCMEFLQLTLLDE